MALPSGATFAGYSVARRLGTGVTGEVYLVQDPRSARWQALKVLSHTMSSDREFRRRFHAETPAAVNLYHPHIVQVHDRGEFEGQLYVAMDYVEGMNAAQLMSDRFPAVSPAGEVLDVVAAVAAALDYAHQRGLLHRDVKPANILLAGRGEGEQQILLTDFGIARRIGVTAGPEASQIPVGTVAYVAPEQLRGADVGARADQYALAATAFHLLTGAPPVEQSDPDAALRRLRGSAPPRLSEQRPELACLDGVFAKALARQPADRFETCRDFAEAASAQAGVLFGDRRTGSVPAVDYPAYAWPDAGDEYAAPLPPGSGAGAAKRRPAGTRLASLARRLDTSSAAGPAPTALAEEARVALALRRRPRKVVLYAGGAVLVAGALALGIVIGRGTVMTTSRLADPAQASSAANGPPTTTAPARAPAPLDGTYRIAVERTKQTYNYIADPQPPDVKTWWAFRSSCTPAGCTAAATRLDDNDHMHAMAPGGSSFFMRFADGQWQSRPEHVDFPCIGPNGSAATQAATLVLSLRPQPDGGFIGEQVLTVRTDECGQRSAVIRIPAVAERRGEVPPAVTVPDPETGPENPAPPTTGSTTAPPGPHHR